MIPWLSAGSLDFPPLEQALTDPNGLLAAGGELSPQRLLSAYRQGIFPWYEDPSPILWWSPDPRTVLYPDQVHISRSLRRRIRRGNFQVTADVDFSAVIEACAVTGSRRRGTWITPEVAAAYTRLHHAGYAHSVEVWMDGTLAGGLYGLALGRMFYGESMFARRTDASKLALVALCRQLQRWEFGMIDCQVHNPHLASMGAIELPRESFAAQLHQHVAESAPLAPGSWRNAWSMSLLEDHSNMEDQA